MQQAEKSLHPNATVPSELTCTHLGPLGQSPAGPSQLFLLSIPTSTIPAAPAVHAHLCHPKPPLLCMPTCSSHAHLSPVTPTSCAQACQHPCPSNALCPFYALLIPTHSLVPPIAVNKALIPALSMQPGRAEFPPPRTRAGGTGQRPRPCPPPSPKSGVWNDGWGLHPGIMGCSKRVTV